MTKISEERKAFLAVFNATALYTATVLHGDDVSKVRIKQIKQYFNRTYNMLQRMGQKEIISDTSFRYGYGGKILIRKVLLQLGVIEKIPEQRPAHYRLKVSPQALNLELVSRIIVEVYLARNDIRDL